MLQFDMICYIEYIEGETQGRYIYNKGDYKKLIEDLSKIDWKREIEELNVEDSWKLFNEHLNKGMNDNIPKTKPTRIKTKPTRTPRNSCG